MLLKRALLAIAIIIMCFYGFKPDTSFITNHYKHQTGRKGIHFEPYSMAYTEFFPDFKGESFTMDFTISPDFPKPTRFGMILQIFDKRDNSQIAVGQWESSLVILNSDDYSNSRKLPKIYAPMDKDAAAIEVTISSGPGGTAVYMDGELVRENPKLRLVPPRKGDAAHLIVGNGINGMTPWKGTLYSLAFRDVNEDDPFLMYTFERGEDSVISDRASSQVPLFLPQEVHSLKKSVLRIPKSYTFNLRSLGADLFLNFFGFVPFGFLITINLPRKESNSRVFHPFLLAVIFSFLFSLSIELGQLWLPGRDSSLLDLLLNISGGSTGSLLAMKMHRFGYL